MNWEVRIMRSGTSFFNGTLYRKMILRFWPLWALYAAFWIMVLPLRFLAEITRRNQWQDGELLDYLTTQAERVPDVLQVGMLVAFLMGVLCAMAVFSYLYSSRSACMIHALPVRREGLFITHYLAGLSFLIVPHLAVYGLMVAIEASIGCLNLWPLTLWLLAQSGMCLFFYSFAVFCAMFTGHLLALPVFYGILNFLVYMIMGLVEQVLTMFLFGFQRFNSAVWAVGDWLTPMTKLGGGINVVYDGAGVASLDNPQAVAVYAVAGVVLAVAAMLVYRQRSVESAGDVVAVHVVRPLFKYGVALCVGLTGGMLTCSILYVYAGMVYTAWMIFWTVVGYFAAEMLLRKSFRVWKAWKGGVVVAGVVCLLGLSLHYDWYGYENWTPDGESVTSVTVFGLDGYPSDGGSYSILREDEEGIQRILELHQCVVDQHAQGNQGNDQDGYLSFMVAYTMEDGREIQRRYNDIPIWIADQDAPGTVTYAAQRIIRDRDNVAQLYDIDRMDGVQLDYGYVDRVWNTEEQQYESVELDEKLDQVWQAVKADFDQGTIGVRYLFDGEDDRMDNTYTADLTLTYLFSNPGDNKETDRIYQGDFMITLTPQAENTLAILKELGVLDETHQLMTWREISMLNY